MTTDNTSNLKLEDVENAISAILVGGQKYKIGSRELTRADLAMLFQMRKELRAQEEDNSGMFLDNTYVAVFKGR